MDQAAGGTLDSSLVAAPCAGGGAFERASRHMDVPRWAGQGCPDPAFNSKDGVVPEQGVIRGIFRLLLGSSLSNTNDDGPIQPVVRPHGGPEVGRATEVCRDVSRQWPVHVPHIANIDPRAIVRLDHIVGIELDHAVLSHDGPIGATVVHQLSIQSRSAHRAAGPDGRIAYIGTSRHGPDEPPLVKVDADVEDVSEAQVQRRLRRRRLLCRPPFHAWWIVLVTRQAARPAGPSSEPKPLSFTPPNGASAAAIATVLTPTMPDSSASLINMARLADSVKA